MLQILTIKFFQRDELDAVALLSMKFSQEKLLMYLLPKPSLMFSNVPSYTHVHKNRLDTVAKVNVA